METEPGQPWSHLVSAEKLCPSCPDGGVRGGGRHSASTVSTASCAPSLTVLGGEVMPNSGWEGVLGGRLGWNGQGGDKEGWRMGRGQAQSGPPCGRCPPGIGRLTDGRGRRKGGVGC
eukprot:3598063-Rhodomonas_salina.2